MDRNYDVGIIGGGIAGAFAALRLAENHKKTKTILFEYGRPPAKRRRQLEGWFGCFPFGDGKIYPEDTNQILEIADGRRVRSMSKWFQSQIDNTNKVKLVKNKLPSVSMQKKVKEAGMQIKTHDYYQWKPESIHQLSRNVADRIEQGGSVTFSFDNEVYSVIKVNDGFNVSTSKGDFYCERLILSAGRSGWRWVNKMYKDLGILVSDDIVKFGARLELPAQYLKELNKSHCSFVREDLQIGPFSWNGQVIQEDHADMTIASFRSNEDRWKSDKVFFSMTISKEFPGEACAQTDRLAKLAFLLSQDRVGRERVRSFMKGDSQLALIPEYAWMKEYFQEIENFIPTIITRGYFHCPDIKSLSSNIRVAPNLETEIPGLFVAGESAGVRGITASGVTGGIAAECVVK